MTRADREPTSVFRVRDESGERDIRLMVRSWWDVDDLQHFEFEIITGPEDDTPNPSIVLVGENAGALARWIRGQTGDL